MPVKQVEVDELYSFVRTLPDRTLATDLEHGEFYLYLPMDRDSKLILNHLVARRNGENCVVFLNDLKTRTAGRFQLSTDGYKGYVGGQYASGVRAAFGDDIDYGSEVKQFGPEVSRLDSNRRSPRKFNEEVCKWVKRTAHIGNPKLDKTNTSRVERLNLSVRLFNRRFTRLTLGYSKRLENHRASAALLVAYFNFCRTHSSPRRF